MPVPDLVRRARAVIHMDMVGGEPAVTGAVFHVTRSPKSLPTFVNDVGEAFGRFVDAQSDAFASTGSASSARWLRPGGGQAGRCRPRWSISPPAATMRVWSEGSFRVPAIYLNDWPDRYIHTHADGVANIDPTKLLRAGFIGAASAWYLAGLDSAQVPALWEEVRRHALERTAGGALARAAELRSLPAGGAGGAQGSGLEEAERDAARDAEDLLRFHLAYEEGVIDSIAAFAAIPPATRNAAAAFLDTLRQIAVVRGGGPLAARAGEAGASAVYRRNPDPKGPMTGFGYSYFEEGRKAQKIAAPALPRRQGLWGAEYAYEALNLVDGRRSVGEIRDALTAIYGPVPLAEVAEYLDDLRRIGVLGSGAAAQRYARRAGRRGTRLVPRGPRGPRGWISAPLPGGGRRQLVQLLFPSRHALAAARRGLQHLEAGANLPQVVQRQRAVEADRFGEIDLGDHGEVGAVEDGRILERLVLALGHRQQHDAQVLAEVVARRTDEVADVLDEEHVERREVPAVERRTDHPGFQVTHGPGGDLAHGRAAAAQPQGIVVGREVADQRGDPRAGAAQVAEGSFEEGRLAGSRTGHQVDDEDAGGGIAAAQLAGQQVVLLQDPLADLNDSGLHHILLDLPAPPGLQLPAPHHLGRGAAAHGAVEMLHVLDLPLAAAGAAEHRHRHLLDLQPAPVDRRVGRRQVGSGKLQRLAHDAGEPPKAHVESRDARETQARNLVAGGIDED